MSDNITREPYRNAWYKQLSDAVKKHDEEIAEMTPHLVPNVEEGDNGKILIAGEEGAFDWGQPPEELPVITEGDEGKVLKVDEGVPKWLEDSDSEYLLVTITRSGTSPNYTYTSDKTYTQIKSFADNGKCIVLYNGTFYLPFLESSTYVAFERFVAVSGVEIATVGETSNYTLDRLDRDYFIFNSNNTISHKTRTHRNPWILAFQLTDNQIFNEANYKYIQVFTNCAKVYTIINNKVISLVYSASNTASSPTEFDFVNYEEGIKAHIDANRLVTITEIPKDLFVYVTQSGTSPNFTYSADHTFNEIHSAIDNGRNVYVKLTGTNNIYQLFIYSDTVCTFAHFLPNYISVYNDAANSKMLANTATSTNDAFVFQANSITRSNVDFYTSYTTDISATSGTFNDAEFWKIVQVRNVRLRYNGYMMYEYYRDNVNTIKFRDVNNTYELVIDGSNKSYTVTTL